ncbi:MFS transporter, partial [Vibrio alfacsensis]
IDVLRTPTFVFHASLCLLAMGVILAYVTSAPVVLMDKMGLTMNEFTYWFGLNAVFNIAACMLAPKIMDKIGTHKTLQLGITTLLVAGGLMAWGARFATPASFMLPVIMSSIGFALILG